MWDDRKAFLHWVPTAWIVLTEDYPLFYSLMRNYPDSLKRGWASHIDPAREFMNSHKELMNKVLTHLKRGPADTSQLSVYGKKQKSTDGWSSGNEVTQLLFHLHMSGKVMVTGHSGNQNIWALTENYLPEWAEKIEFSHDDLEKKTSLRALKALGIASEQDIFRYFVRGRYTNLKTTLKDLVDESDIVRVRIEGETKSRQMFILNEDAEKLHSISSDDWDKEVALISPFDNVVTLRERLERMFSFEYRLEQFVPKKQRKFGTYVLPVLYGSEMVGRIDARFDKQNATLTVNSVYAEQGYGEDETIGMKLMRKIEDLASFLGAETISIGNKKPEKWSRFLK